MCEDAAQEMTFTWCPKILWHVCLPALFSTENIFISIPFYRLAIKRNVIGESIWRNVFGESICTETCGARMVDPNQKGKEGMIVAIQSWVLTSWAKSLYWSVYMGYLEYLVHLIILEDIDLMAMIIPQILSRLYLSSIWLVMITAGPTGETTPWNSSVTTHYKGLFFYFFYFLKR